MTLITQQIEHQATTFRGSGGPAPQAPVGQMSAIWAKPLHEGLSPYWSVRTLQDVGVVRQWSLLSGQGRLVRKPATTSTIATMIMVYYGKTYMRLHQCVQFGCGCTERTVD